MEQEVRIKEIEQYKESIKAKIDGMKKVRLLKMVYSFCLGLEGGCRKEQIQ